MLAEPDVVRLMAEMARNREAFALATVIETTGSTSARPGHKAIIDPAGLVRAGWVGGGCAESTACETALSCMADGKPRIIELNLDDEVLGTGMPCGGTMRVFIEPMLPAPALWLLGHGRVAEALCRFGAELGYSIMVNDTPRPDPLRFLQATELIGDDYSYERLKPTAADSVVIATQHKGDHLSAVRALRSPTSYIAIVASKKRASLMREFLHSEGFTDQELARLRAPAGLDLGAWTPAEIAFSILAEIVMLRRGGSGLPRTL